MGYTLVIRAKEDCVEDVQDFVAANFVGSKLKVTLAILSPSSLNRVRLKLKFVESRCSHLKFSSFLKDVKT